MSPMLDDGAWSLVVVMPPSMRDQLRAWQIETRNLSGSVYPAATVALVQVRAALADLGVNMPPVRVQRAGSQVALDSSAVRARAMMAGDARRTVDRLQLRVEPQRYAALADAARQYGHRSTQAAIVTWVMSRAGSPVPPCLADGTLRPPRGHASTGRRSGPPPRPTVGEGVDYVAAHLRRCRERAARDAWLVDSAGRREPASTVDDHLGRAVHGCDRRAMASEAMMREREEVGGHRHTTDESGMVRTYDGIGRARYSWGGWRA